MCRHNQPWCATEECEVGTDRVGYPSCAARLVDSVEPDCAPNPRRMEEPPVPDTTVEQEWVQALAFYLCPGRKSCPLTDRLVSPNTPKNDPPGATSIQADEHSRPGQVLEAVFLVLQAVRFLKPASLSPPSSAE